MIPKSEQYDLLNKMILLMNALDEENALPESRPEKLGPLPIPRRVFVAKPYH